ncbi:hypothetical protein [Rubinisphaera margarita]|uniref:hypothetical protein n=1 Tax=Rubinisphaera margarita TaxID=2909586 RepID=UPI001EE93DC3|nr:hypothetical protein [Rubinisphaera margarita]MCG6155402.1 hypothetical protein [Rubinisphaera margarita]
MLLTTTALISRLMVIGPVVAQSSNTGGGIPWIDLLLVLAAIGGTLFAVCRSANRR